MSKEESSLRLESKRMYPGDTPIHKLMDIASTYGSLCQKDINAWIDKYVEQFNIEHCESMEMLSCVDNLDDYENHIAMKIGAELGTVVVKNCCYWKDVTNYEMLPPTRRTRFSVIALIPEGKRKRKRR